MSEHPDFDNIIAAGWTDSESETPSLAAAVDALMASNEVLAKRLAYYEEQAQRARHGFRDLKKASSQKEATIAHDEVRNSLRNIHPTTAI